MSDSELVAIYIISGITIGFILGAILTRVMYID